jgi:hypothetical protein
MASEGRDIAILLARALGLSPATTDLDRRLRCALDTYLPGDDAAPAAQPDT